MFSGVQKFRNITVYPIISVNRMVKYTGYGNCAGLLANRGLMLGGQGQGDYSSDSEDSETEEYSNLANK